LGVKVECAIVGLFLPFIEYCNFNALFGLRRKLRNKIPEPSTHIVGNINVVGGDNKGSGILFPRKRLTPYIPADISP
jgi:hypothetical protein